MAEPFNTLLDSNDLARDTGGIKRLDLRRRITTRASFALREQSLRYGCAQNAAVGGLGRVTGENLHGAASHVVSAHLFYKGQLLRRVATALDGHCHGAWSLQSLYQTMQRITTIGHCEPHLQRNSMAACATSRGDIHE